MPASLLIDKNGEIRYEHFGESMSDIPENLQILSPPDDLTKNEIQTSSVVYYAGC